MAAGQDSRARQQDMSRALRTNYVYILCVRCRCKEMSLLKRSLLKQGHRHEILNTLIENSFVRSLGCLFDHLLVCSMCWPLPSQWTRFSEVVRHNQRSTRCPPLSCAHIGTRMVGVIVGLLEKCRQHCLIDCWKLSWQPH